MKDRAIITEELNNLKKKDSSIFLIYGTYGISKDLSKILKADEKILCYASACAVKGMRLYKYTIGVRTYLVCTDRRLIYIEHKRANIIGVFVPNKQEIIPYGSMESVSLNPANKMSYDQKLSVMDRRGRMHEYYITDKKAGGYCYQTISEYIYQDNIGENQGRFPVVLENHHNNQRMVCSYCGNELSANSIYCTNCGKKVGRTTVRQKRSSPLRYLLILVPIIFVILLLSVLFNENKFVKVVKDGYFEGYPNISVGDAFEEFFYDPEWSYTDLEGKSDSGIKHSVEFEGSCYINDVQTKVTMWFVVDDTDEETFWLNGGYIEGSPEGIEVEDIALKAVEEGNE